VRYLKASGFVIEPDGRKPQFVPPDAPIYVRNDSGEEIPPFACLQTTGTVDIGGQNYVTVDKPIDDTGDAGWYLFNGIAPIPATGTNIYGIAYDGPLVRMLTDGSAIVCGEKWQPDVGQWAIIPGGEMFTAVGADDIEPDVMRGFMYRAGGGGGASIQYTIDSIEIPTSGPYTGKVVATVTVETAPCGRVSLIGESVQVVDHSGCVFDLPEADLEGVWGWATEQVALSTAAGSEPGELTPCHWAADDRCCVAGEGDSSGGGSGGGGGGGGGFGDF
jgi:hypothetical protein